MQLITIMRKELDMNKKEPYNDLQAMCDNFIKELYAICNGFSRQEGGQGELKAEDKRMAFEEADWRGAKIFFESKGG